MKIQTFGKIIRILIPSIILISILFFLINQESTQPSTKYYQGKITKIIDADTLEIDNKTIRLALVDAPEYNQEGYEKAKQFTQSICPISSTAIIDVDQEQPTDKFNRTIAVVYCNNTNLNAELLINNHAFIDKRYCNISEFKNEEWAKGC